MKRISHRMIFLLVLMGVLVFGLGFFTVRYFVQAGQWVTFSGSPHVYAGSNLSTGKVVDRRGTLLLDSTDGRVYSEDTALRQATMHLLGDRYGYIAAPILNKYADEMIGKTYCWISNTKPYTITAFFTISNDSIKTISLSSSSKNRLNRTLPNAKRGRSYPAVLIGRVGVNTEFRGLNIGTQLIQFIKDWFCAKDNKTGCRFLIVDAYNQESVLAFYKRNGFKYLYADEEEEKI